MSNQKSTSFGKLKRPSGKEFRSGTLGTALDDLYADIDDAFESIEKGSAHEPVRLATAVTLGQKAVTYLVTKPANATVLTKNANGALTIDGVLVANGDRILVNITHSDSLMYKGIYTVTDLGTAGTPWVLTRADDMNETDDVIEGRTVAVSAGQINAGSIWSVSTKPTVLDTNTLAWSSFGGTSQLDGVRSMRITYDFATHGGLISTIGLGKYLPANAIITRSWIVSTATVVGVGASIAFGHPQATAGIITATAITGLGAGSMVEGAATGALSAFAAPTTAVREISAVVSGAAITAGTVVAFIEYVVYA